MTRATWLITLAVVCVATPAWADTIILKDGRQYEGEVVRRENQLVIQKAEGGFVPIRDGDVQKTILNNATRTEKSSEVEWTRIQAMVRRSDNIAEIVSAYEKFLADYPDAPSSAMAKATLEEFRKMQQDKYVKFRGRWMPQAQVEVTLRAAEEKARPALDLYRAGRLKEAVDSAREALRRDEQNLTALAVAGLASYRLNSLPAAREYFTKLTEFDPSSALGWNNLAVVSFLQKREPEALLHYAKALGSAPQNRQVLDNIMDATIRYSGSKTIPAYTNLMRQFKAPEAAMEAKLAESDLYRFGNTWINKAQRDRQAAVVAAVQAQMDKLDAQYRQALADSDTLNRQIQQVSSDLDTALSLYASYNIAALNAQARGYYDPYTESGRSAVLGEVARLRSQLGSLQQTQTALNAALQQMPANAKKLTELMAKAQNQQTQVAQRVLEISEVDDPPPPAAIDLPEIPAGAAPAGAPAGAKGVGAGPAARDNQFPTIQNVSYPQVVPLDPRSSMTPGYPGIVTYPNRVPAARGHCVADRSGMMTNLNALGLAGGRFSLTPSGIVRTGPSAPQASRQAMVQGQQMWRRSQMTLQRK